MVNYIRPGPAQQNLGAKTKILYGAFLCVNINLNKII